MGLSQPSTEGVAGRTVEAVVVVEAVPLQVWVPRRPPLVAQPEKWELPSRSQTTGSSIIGLAGPEGILRATTAVMQAWAEAEAGPVMPVLLEVQVEVLAMPVLAVAELRPLARLAQLVCRRAEETVVPVLRPLCRRVLEQYRAAAEVVV